MRYIQYTQYVCARIICSIVSCFSISSINLLWCSFVLLIIKFTLYIFYKNELMLCVIKYTIIWSGQIVWVVCFVCCSSSSFSLDFETMQQFSKLFLSFHFCPFHLSISITAHSLSSSSQNLLFLTNWEHTRTTYCNTIRIYHANISCS